MVNLVHGRCHPKSHSLVQSRGDGLRLLEEIGCFAHSSGILTIPGFQLLAVKLVVLIGVAGKELSHQGCRVRARNGIFTSERGHVLQKVLASSSKTVVMELQSFPPKFQMQPESTGQLWRYTSDWAIPSFGGTHPGIICYIALSHFWWYIPFPKENAKICPLWF